MNIVEKYLDKVQNEVSSAAGLPGIDSFPPKIILKVVKKNIPQNLIKKNGNKI